MPPIFSYFNYRTRLHSERTGSAISVVRYQLEKSDQDEGRFWVGLIHAFRAIIPGIGQTVLTSLVDHHHQPIPVTLAQLANELLQKNWGLILENSYLVSSTNWWTGFVEWLQQFKENHSIVLKEEAAGKAGIEAKELIQKLSPPMQIALAASEVWWSGWYLEEFPGENWLELMQKLRVANYINDFSPEIILPRINLFTSLQNQLRGEATILVTQQIRRMVDWLQDQGQWLEATRLMLTIKEFEQASDILQEKGEDWLAKGADPLEVLFWLKELPGILLTSKPGLCIQAAQSASKLGFDFQVSYFLGTAENNLYALQRFSKNDKLWREMVLDENGSTVQGYLDQISKIRIGEKS